MKTLIQYIEWLLIDHDCVILPGFGAFVAGYESAEIKDSTFTAPQRIITFNPSIKHDDGLLTHFVSELEGESYGKAQCRVNEAVKSLEHALYKKGERVKMGVLGTLESHGGSLEFRSGGDMGGECYGLRSFGFLPLAERKRALMVSLTDASTSADKPNLYWLSKKAIRTAASIALLVGLGFLLSTPLIVDRTNHHDTASLMTTQLTQAPKQVIETLPAEPSQTVMPLADNQGKYFLVICTMQSQAGAEEYCAAHSDIKTHISHRGRHYRIYVSSSDDKAELYKIKKQLPEKYKKSWVGS